MLKAAYSGVPGSYAEEAAIRYFDTLETVGGDPAVQLVTASSFADAFEAVKDGRADQAVLPIENSSTGSISAVYDLIAQYGFSIVGEQSIQVDQCLMAKPGTQLDEITQVYSHEQGISQSRDFLEGYPHWRLTPVYNTAAAAKMVSESPLPGQAAIASSRAAELYGLEILVAKTNFKEQNQTRFVVLAPEPHHSSKNDKVSLMFTLPHVSGSLYQILGIFAREKLNLLKIESRPMANRNWEYLFFLDFSADTIDARLERILDEVSAKAQTLRVLGYYQSGVSLCKTSQIPPKKELP